MLPRILDSAKKKKKGVRNTIKNRNSTRPTRWCCLHPKGSIFFFGRGGDFFGSWCSQCVPIMLPIHSLRVPPSSQLVPQDVPNSIKLLCHSLCAKLNFHNLYKKVGQQRKAFLYSYFKGPNFNLKGSLPKFKNFGYEGQSK
jgi:hypothetical protein